MRSRSATARRIRPAAPAGAWRFKLSRLEASVTAERTERSEPAISKVTVYGVASGAEVSGAALFGLNQAMTRSKKVGSFACASEASSGEATTAQMPTLLRASIFAACDDRRISLRTLVLDLQIRPAVAIAAWATGRLLTYLSRNATRPTHYRQAVSR